MQAEAGFDWRKYLESLVNYEAQYAANYAVERPTIEPFMEFLSAMGSPNLKLNTIIIAGSKGKGTTAATLEAMFLSSNRNVGLYTSPHVFTMNERIRAGGVDITDSDLASLLSRVEYTSHRTGYMPSWFEAITAAAFLYFFDKACDPVILEVGLGGRLDSTNVTSPHVALITDILLEHTTVLGDTTGLIADEKAEVMKPGTRTISVGQDPEVTRALTEFAGSVGSTLKFIDVSADDLRAGVIHLSIEGRSYEVELCFDSVVLNRNNTLAAAGYISYCSSPPPAGYRKFLYLRGRYERGRAFGLEILLDGAHTPESLEALLSHVGRRKGKSTVVFASLGDKRVFEMLDIVLSHVSSIRGIVFIRMDDARAVDADLLCDYVKNRLPDVKAAVYDSRMLRSALTGSTRVVVTGSFRLLREFVSNSDYTMSRDV